MKERIEKLRRTAWAFDNLRERGFLNELLDVISDLTHKVEEFEPEEITEEDVMSLGYPTTTSLLQQAIERDKLAKELVEGILNNSGSLDRGVMELAIQLKEKLDAPTKPCV